MDDSMRGGFLLRFIAVMVGVVLAVILCFVFLSDAFARWGFIGGFIFLGLVLLLFGWLYDRRQAKQDREWGT
jgi:hypothetical protein